MKTSAAKKSPPANLTLLEVDALGAEIADQQLACDALRADIQEKFRALDERLALIKAAARPDIERLQSALAAVEKSLDERRQAVENQARGLGARAEFQARPECLAALGLRITQEDVCYLVPVRAASDAFGKEAR